MEIVIGEGNRLNSSVIIHTGSDNIDISENVNSYVITINKPFNINLLIFKDTAEAECLLSKLLKIEGDSSQRLIFNIETYIYSLVFINANTARFISIIKDVIKDAERKSFDDGYEEAQLRIRKALGIHFS